MFEQVLDLIGFGLCHQLPERSFFGGAVQVPVCARDTGIYVGFMVALLTLALVHRDRPSRVPPVWVSALLALGVLAMAVDGVTSYAGLRPTTNEIRLLTGLLTGYAIAAWIMPIMSGELWAETGPGRVLGDALSRTAFLGSLVVAYAFVWWVAPTLGPAFPAVVAFCIVGTFTAVNLVIVALLPPFNRAARSLRDIVPASGIALALAAVELLASSALKAWLLRVVS